VTSIRGVSEVLAGPTRFWAGAGLFLLVVAGVAYSYGAWYAGVLVLDAVPVQELKAGSSWVGQFKYITDGSGIERRIFHPGPDSFSAEVVMDDLMSVDVSSAGYSSGQAWELAKDEEKTESEAKTETTGISRAELIKNLKDTGMVSGAEEAGRLGNSVTVGVFGSEEEARVAAARLRDSGRPASVTAIKDSSGKTTYRLESGAFGSQEEAAAYQHELESQGLMGSSTPPAGGSSNAGGAAPAGGGTTPPATGGGGPTTGPGDNQGGNGGGTTPPPTGGSTGNAGAASGGSSSGDSGGSAGPTGRAVKDL